MKKINGSVLLNGSEVQLLRELLQSEVRLLGEWQRLLEVEVARIGRPEMINFINKFKIGRESCMDRV